MFRIVALTALGPDKRERDGGPKKERESVYADILPAGLVIDEPQSPLGARDGTTHECSLSYATPAYPSVSLYILYIILYIFTVYFPNH